MDKRTKKRALKQCRDHWQWVADNPGSTKFGYPKSKGQINQCFLCDAVSKYKRIGSFDLNCKKHCPLVENLWTKPDANGQYHCEHLSSPYRKQKVDWTNRRKYALQIVEACDELLECL